MTPSFPTRRSADRYWIAARGREVAPGYKPDVTVRDASGALACILEAEQKTDRKAFLGDLIKAEMYAEQEGANPTLLIVMQPQPNTTTEQIANHQIGRASCRERVCQYV